MKQVASLKYGVIFKKAFSRPEIFTAFVRDILGVTIEIDHVDTEKSFTPVIGQVNAQFDLFAEDKKNRIIVDIQHTRHADHYDRFLHYHCMALMEQIKTAKNYRPEITVYTIVVLTSGDKHKNDVSIIDFDPKNLKGESVGEIKHKVIYLCPKYVNNETPVAYKEWLEAIDDSLDEVVDEQHYKNRAIQSIFNIIEKEDITPDERAIMFDEYNQREHEETLKQETMDIVAKKMLIKGMEISLISEITGLTVDEINQVNL